MKLSRQAHDEAHEGIWIRRGICRGCRITFTVLPDWSRSDTTAFVVGNRLVNESQTGTLSSKRRRTAKIPLDCRMRRPCAAG